MIKEFQGWPSAEDFTYHVNRFEPFLSRSIGTFPLDLSELALCEDIVDISCIEKTPQQPKLAEPSASFDNNVREFRGNVNERDLLYLELKKFVEAFLARQSGCRHWLGDGDLKLYLSQLLLFSSEDKLTTKNPVSRSISKIYSKIEKYTCISTQELYQVNLWMNLDEAISSLHYDGNHNILSVQTGRKNVLLLSPKHTPFLQPGPACSTAQANHSALTCVSEEFLQSQDLSGGGIFQFTLQAGDAVFIPEGWWHRIVSDECTIAANWWFRSPLYHLMRNDSINSYMLRATTIELTAKRVEALVPHEPKGKAGAYASQERFAEHVGRMMALLKSSVAAGAASPREELPSDDIKAQLEEEFANCALVDLLETWLPHSIAHPGQLHTVLLSLEPISALKLLVLWDSAEDVWDQEHSRSFFTDFFRLSGTAIRTYMIKQVDKLWQQSSLEMLASLRVV